MDDDLRERGLLVGDAVIPRYEPDHEVMTVWDFATLAGGIRVARCNWVVGPKDEMKYRDVPVLQLTRVRRKTDVE